MQSSAVPLDYLSDRTRAEIEIRPFIELFYAYDVAQACLNGHAVNEYARSLPEHRQVLGSRPANRVCYALDGNFVGW